MKTKLLPLLLFTFATNAFAALDTPTEDFIDNNDGTVLHKKTGLSWQRCSVGQTWSSGTCTGTAQTMDWNVAMASYGKTDCSEWRLPRIDELKTIVERGVSYPAINSYLFPKLNESSGWFWSATDSNSEQAWNIQFNSGNSSGTRPKTEAGILAVRLVRGGQSCSGEYTPLTDFIDNNDGTVTHLKTGLTWQRCSIGQSWDGTTCTGSPTPMTWHAATAQTSTVGGMSDWRLPTTNELETITEYKNLPVFFSPNPEPFVNTLIFPNTPSNYFWTKSIAVFNPNEATGWIVSFANGEEVATMKYDPQLVRLVRDTWKNIVESPIPTTIDLSTTLSQSSNRVKINENLTYTAAVINNGTGTANNSLLKIYLPPRNVSIVSMPSDCVTTGKSLTCSLGNLAAGANASRAITVNYIKSGGASVGALALTDSEDMNSNNNFSRVVTAIKK